MIAFEVSLNGERVCVAGAEDLAVLAAGVTACGTLGKKTVPVRSDESWDIHYRVGGLTGRKDESKDVHMTWTGITELNIGDVIEIKVLETDKVDRPKSRKRAKKNPVRGAE